MARKITVELTEAEAIALSSAAQEILTQFEQGDQDDHYTSPQAQAAAHSALNRAMMKLWMGGVGIALLNRT